MGNGNKNTVSSFTAQPGFPSAKGKDESLRQQKPSISACDCIILPLLKESAPPGLKEFFRKSFFPSRFVRPIRVY